MHRTRRLTRKHGRSSYGARRETEAPGGIEAASTISRNGHLSCCEPTGVRYGAFCVRANPRTSSASHAGFLLPEERAGLTSRLALEERMPNTKLRYILKDQRPTVLALTDTVQNACRCMCECRIGSVLVIDEHQRLRGIFTGRDAVRVLSEGRNASKTLLNQVMTPDPVTIGPRSRAIDALRAMSDGGFRHVPVLDGDRIWGVVSRSDFSGAEIEQLEEEVHLSEVIW